MSANRLVNGAGNTVVLHGVNKSGSEYACIDGWGFFDGPADQASVEAMKAWSINAVRVPLNSACWLDLRDQFATYNASYSGANYQKAIKDYVDLLNRNGIYAILDLQWTGCGTSPCSANWLKPMPDRPYATQFWSSVGAMFQDNRAVLFDLFNEPQSVDWACWMSGGCTVFAGTENEFTAEGMQQMVTAVRTAGATTQPLLLGGLQYSNDMRGWKANLPTDPSNSIAASIHLYNFNYPCPAIVDGTQSAQAAVTCFTDEAYNSIESIAEAHPVVFGELGQDNCRSDFVTPMLEWVESRGFSSLGWAWNTQDCASFPALISHYDGTPTPFGKAFRDFYTANDGQPVTQGTSIISLDAPAFASSGSAANANDATYDSIWSPENPSDWLAFDLSAVPEPERGSVILAWYTSPDDGHSVGALQGVCPVWSGRPYLGDYTVEANSAPGGGDPPSAGWVTLASVAENGHLSRQHLLDFRGYNWIRLKGSGPNGVGINVDVANAGETAGDGWLFLGDSITAIYAGHGSASGPSGATIGSFTELISAGTDGASRPIAQNAGMSCARSWDALAWIDPMLEAFPGKYVTLGFGTNDGWAGLGDPLSFYGNMEALVAKVTAAGKVPVVPTIPWPNNPGDWAANTTLMNDQILRLYAEHPDVVKGPDLFRLLEGKPELFQGAGDVHPNSTGAAAIRVAWSEAMLANVYGRSG